MSTLSRRSIYWICQFTGWTGLMLLDVIWYLLRSGYDYGLLINALVNIALGVGITHTYRLVIKRLSWLDLPLDELTPRILVSVAGMALIMASFNIPLDFSTLPAVEQEAFTIPLGSLLFIYMVTWSRHLLLWSLIYHVFQYFERSKKNEIEKVRLSSSIKEFEAKLLRSQLNPHFVFNALNSIRALVLENPAKAQVSVTQLSNLLRNSLLADRRRTVALGEEMKTVRDYLELEKIRYEDRLRVETNVSAEALPVQVPPMMVQTLVENAVKHGISKPVGGGFISIQAGINGNRLCLQIRNTGTLEENVSSDGFGLVNTRQRLDLLYGTAASLDISQESGGVVCAVVHLPA